MADRDRDVRVEAEAHRLRPGRVVPRRPAERPGAVAREHLVDRPDGTARRAARGGDAVRRHVRVAVEQARRRRDGVERVEVARRVHPLERLARRRGWFLANQHPDRGALQPAPQRVDARRPLRVRRPRVPRAVGAEDCDSRHWLWMVDQPELCNEWGRHP
jgi:hypothetical protein